jgi:hypothetical protein
LNIESQLPAFLVESSLAQKVSERLVTPFNTMTTFFLRRSVEKAFQLDEAPADLTLNRHRPLTSNPPYITSAVDDIMYIVNKVLRQSLATAQRAVVTSVVPTLARILGSDFIGMIQRKMRDESYPKAAVPGGFPPEATVIAFLVLINNLDIAIDYVRRIVHSNVEQSSTNMTNTTIDPMLGGSVPEESSCSALSTLFPLADDAETVAHTLETFSASFESKAQDLIGDGIQVVFNNVIKSRLRPILADAFRDVDYQPHADEGGDGESLNETVEIDGDLALDGITGGHGSLVRHRFTFAWRDLLAPISRILTGRAFDRLLGVAVGSLARLLEKRLWSYHGRVNALGATRLERDVTGIAAAAVDVAGVGFGRNGGGHGEGRGEGGRYRHREAFGRCIQLVTVIGMEEEEWEAVLEGGGEGLDRLSVEERARARAIVS